MSSQREHEDGSREEMDEAGWRFIRDGKVVVSIGSDGSNLLTGTIKTAMTGRRRELGPDGWTEVAD